MKLLTITLVPVAGLVLCTAPLAYAANDSFVGKWKMNPDKSQFNGLQYKIEKAGDNKYRFAFGDDVETVGVDGKDYPTKYGNTWAISEAGPNVWKFTQKRNGKVTANATWTVSNDGKTFTSVDETMRPDGSTAHSETKLKRTGGKSGFVGTWESTKVKISTPTMIEIAPWSGDGYSLMNPNFKERANFKLDGKDYPDKGPRVAKGTTISAKKTGDGKLELTYKLKGKMTEIDHWQLSSNGKVLTNTINFSGVSKPETDVYERQ